MFSFWTNISKDLLNENREILRIFLIFLKDPLAVNSGFLRIFFVKIFFEYFFLIVFNKQKSFIFIWRFFFHLRPNRSLAEPRGFLRIFVVMIFFRQKITILTQKSRFCRKQKQKSRKF